MLNKAAVPNLKVFKKSVLKLHSMLIHMYTHETVQLLRLW